MNCYLVELRLTGVWEEPVGTVRDYRDPAVETRWNSEIFGCEVAVWANSKERAKEIARNHDYSTDEYDVKSVVVMGAFFDCEDPEWTEEELEVTYQEGVQ